VDSLLSLLFYFPLNRRLNAVPKNRRSHSSGPHLIQIRLYGFCEKAHYFVKTIQTDYQKAREWLAKSAVNRISEDPEPD
jgi:hypothetical protein